MRHGHTSPTHIARASLRRRLVTSAVSRVQHYEDGNVYDGEWRNDQRAGRGTMRFGNGGVYDGQWVQDKVRTHEDGRREMQRPARRLACTAHLISCL